MREARVKTSTEQVLRTGAKRGPSVVILDSCCSVGGTSSVVPRAVTLKYPEAELFQKLLEASLETAKNVNKFSDLGHGLYGPQVFSFEPQPCPK